MNLDMKESLLWASSQSGMNEDVLGLLELGANVLFINKHRVCNIYFVLKKYLKF